ncbi:hypothetical protein [Enterobacter bugandensis]|uniref:ParE family toxin-like protein n=1 Tax=Enterobacter bugandensis TaxID=881260 RepID=UPI0010A487AF
MRATRPSIEASELEASLLRVPTCLIPPYAKGRRNYSRIAPHHYLVIRLGCRWQLLSMDGGKVWSLLTHEKYNVESKK